jgi:hypothetical protein
LTAKTRKAKLLRAQKRASDRRYRVKQAALGVVVPEIAERQEAQKAAAYRRRVLNFQNPEKVERLRAQRLVTDQRYRAKQAALRRLDPEKAEDWKAQTSVRNRRHRIKQAAKPLVIDDPSTVTQQAATPADQDTEAACLREIHWQNKCHRTKHAAQPLVTDPAGSSTVQDSEAACIRTIHWQNWQNWQNKCHRTKRTSKQAAQPPQVVSDPVGSSMLQADSFTAQNLFRLNFPKF